MKSPNNWHRLNQNHLLPDRISEIIGRIGELYSSYFDQNWFTTFLGDFPMTTGQFYDIRACISISEPVQADIPVIQEGLKSLKVYIQLLKETIVPEITNISSRKTSKRNMEAMTSESRTRTEIIAYLLPLNLNTLEDLVKELEESLPKMPVSKKRINRIGPPFRH